MKDMLYALLALVSAGVAIYFLRQFQNYDNSTSMIIGIIFALVAVAFGLLFIFGRVNRHDEIHITE